MFEGARRLVAWGTLAGAALIGCRENVYLGKPTGFEDHSMPEAEPPNDAPVPIDAPDAPILDAPFDASEPEPPFPWYLHRVGSKILDSNDQPVRLRGINWSGMQTTARVPDGLHRRTVDDIVTQIENLKFNLIRIPYSNESILPTSTPVRLNPLVDPVGGDPDLAGLSSLEIVDHIIAAALRHHIRVILDHYRFLADTSLPSKTWYSGPDPSSTTGGYPESQWIADWVTLVTRYQNQPNMVGCDLHDEPMTPSTWGDSNPNTDWRLAAERAGKAILDKNPNLVILVQGIDVVAGQTYWPGGNLRGAQASPVRLSHPEKLFYSVRDWGKSVNTDEPWFAPDAGYPNNLPMLWDDTWESLVANDVAPVVVGAFGDRGNVPGDDGGLIAADHTWRTALTSYIDSHQLSFVFWALNPSAEGRSGLLQPDWQTPDPDWSSLLHLTP
jgi:endoglucanase